MTARFPAAEAAHRNGWPWNPWTRILSAGFTHENKSPGVSGTEHLT
jgi:hypothetical protein